MNSEKFFNLIRLMHQAGRHNQLSHGMRYSSASAVKAGLKKLRKDPTAYQKARVSARKKFAKAKGEQSAKPVTATFSAVGPGDRYNANVADLAADYKARGIDRQAAYGALVKDKNFNPGIDNKEFQRVWDSVEAKPLISSKMATGPVMELEETYGTPKRKVIVTSEDEHSISWIDENGISGGTPRAAVKNLTPVTEGGEKPAIKTNLGREMKKGNPENQYKTLSPEAKGALQAFEKGFHKTPEGRSFMTGTPTDLEIKGMKTPQEDINSARQMRALVDKGFVTEHPVIPGQTARYELTDAGEKALGISLPKRQVTYGTGPEPTAKDIRNWGKKLKIDDARAQLAAKGYELGEGNASPKGGLTYQVKTPSGQTVTMDTKQMAHIALSPSIPKVGPLQSTTGTQKVTQAVQAGTKPKVGTTSTPKTPRLTKPKGEIGAGRKQDLKTLDNLIGHIEQNSSSKRDAEIQAASINNRITSMIQGARSRKMLNRAEVKRYNEILRSQESGSALLSKGLSTTVTQLKTSKQLLELLYDIQERNS